jgi:hypothetical protein
VARGKNIEGRRERPRDLVLAAPLVGHHPQLRHHGGVLSGSRTGGWEKRGRGERKA